MIKSRYLLSLLVLLLSACGGGDTSPGSCDTQLTTGYVDNALSTKDTFTVYGITPSNTKLIAEDGNQGGSYDIDKVMLTTISSTVKGNSIALSYSTYATQAAPTGSSIAFYIDTDRQAITGDPKYGAEYLIVDRVGHGSDLIYSVYHWELTGWVDASSAGSTASYYAGCSLGLAIFIPWGNVMSNIDLTQARGRLVFTTFNSGDPGDSNPPIDSTQAFDFAFP